MAWVIFTVKRAIIFQDGLWKPTSFHELIFFFFPSPFPTRLAACLPNSLSLFERTYKPSNCLYYSVVKQTCSQITPHFFISSLSLSSLCALLPYKMDILCVLHFHVDVVAACLIPRSQLHIV